MAGQKFGGKSKTELTFEAFAKHGDNCTKGQWGDHLRDKGCEAADSLYYNVKNIVPFMREAAGKGLSLAAARKYVANKSKLQAFSEALYGEMLSSRKEINEVLASRNVTPAVDNGEHRVENGVIRRAIDQPRETHLGDTLRRYYRFKSLVDNVGEDVVGQIASLVTEVGADGVDQMLAVYKELKESNSPPDVP